MFAAELRLSREAVIPLTDDRWRRLESLFLAAVDLPPAERHSFVARETGGDPVLGRELAGMLATMQTVASASPRRFRLSRAGLQRSPPGQAATAALIASSARSAGPGWAWCSKPSVTMPSTARPLR
jgi:hypothetical protein